MIAGFSFGRSRLVVRVTRSHINRGQARSCYRCAVALALMDALRERRLPQWGINFSPYACWVTPTGLTLSADPFNGSEFANLPADKLPAGLAEWAIGFDDWAEWQETGGAAKEWEKKTGCHPFRPQPAVFVFDLGSMTHVKGR